MNIKHTPGPWKHSSFQVWAQGAAGNTFGTLVASLREAPATDAVAEADAHLIAAAPELLEALKDAERGLFRYALADAHKWTGDVSGELALAHANSVVSGIRAAIAKATGETI